MNTPTPKLLRLNWVDQLTNNPKKTSDFYSSLLGFEQKPHDEGKGFTSYSLTNEEGEEVFGIVEEAVFPNWSHGWVVYFEVDDLEGSCDMIPKLGGEVIHKSKNQCLFRDPAGAPTVLIRATKN